MAAAGSAGVAAGADAGSVPNYAPPAIPDAAVLDLSAVAGAVPTADTVYSFDFVAETDGTALTFYVRDDPSFTVLYDVSLVNVNQSAKNLLCGSIAAQTCSTSKSIPSGSSPISWTYANPAPNTNGQVTFGGSFPYPGSYSIDGAEQGYDEITATLPTVQGSDYKLSFDAYAMGGLTQWARVSNNGQPGSGGNGADLVAAALHVAGPIPETSTWAMLAMGFAGLACLGWRRRASAAAPA